MTLTTLGDAAVVLELAGSLDDAKLMRVRMLAAELTWNPPSGVIEVVPAFGSIAVFFDPARVPNTEDLWVELLRRAELADSVPPFETGRNVEIPVSYGGVDGPDLGYVAAHAGLPVEEIIALHSGAEYRVLAMGFSPGFPYLGGLPERLHTPRRATPRTLVAAGSVGIGGTQTGVYPIATPGGWNLIGRTALRLFNPEAEPPALLGVGDRVKFVLAPNRKSEPKTGVVARHDSSMSQLGHAAVFADGNEPPAGPIVQHDKSMSQLGHGSALGHLGDGKERRAESGAVIQVIRAGPLTTVQDLGRNGHRAAGLPLSGAADAVALRIANLLVGNEDGAAALECTLVGPELVFPDETVIAVGGAGFDGLPTWEPRVVGAGERIAFGPCRGGCRSYIAIAGGIDVPKVLGSRSTYLAAGIGGFLGRALHDGDRVPVGAPAHAVRVGRWHVDPRLLPDYAGSGAIRVLRGTQAEDFDRAWLDSEFTVTRQFDRMGVRLHGPAIVSRAAGDLLSGVMVPGTIQVPADGGPIVLLADAQTIGGYPKLAHVIDVDLPLIAQRRAGDRLNFQEITLSEALKARHAREHGLALLRQGIAGKYGLADGALGKGAMHDSK